MKQILVIALLIAPLPAVADAAAEQKFIAQLDTAFAYCEAQWGTDYAMIDYCRQKSADALIRANSIMNDIRSADSVRRDALIDILARCQMEWNVEGETYDWPMVVYCYDRQHEAAVSLGKL